MPRLPDCSEPAPRPGTSSSAKGSTSPPASCRNSSNQAWRSGPTLPHVSEILGGTLPVVTVASHDTVSAVAAIPMDPATAAYVSCGTWGLVGVETERPVLTENARLSNFTNEAGLDGRNRLLHNVMGLWLFNESIRTWNLDDEGAATAGLVDEAAGVERPVAVFDPNDPRFCRLATFLLASPNSAASRDSPCPAVGPKWSARYSKALQQRLRMPFAPRPA